MSWNFRRCNVIQNVKFVQVFIFFLPNLFISGVMATEMIIFMAQLGNFIRVVFVFIMVSA